MIDDAQLIERLQEADLLSDRQLDEARDFQESEDRTLYEVLIAHHIVDEPPLVEIVSEVLNVAAVDPRDFQPNSDILALVPAAVALDNWALPLETERADGDTRLVLAMRDPIDMFAMDEIAGHTDIDIRPVLAGPRALYDALRHNYGDEAQLDLDTPFERAEEAGPLGDASRGPEGDSDSWPSVDESNPNETHPGLVTSNISDIGETDQEKVEEQKRDDEAEAWDEAATDNAPESDEDSSAPEELPSKTPDQSAPSREVPESGVHQPKASPVPTEGNLAVDSDPHEATLESPAPDEEELDDDNAIGRIPVKRVPASQLEGDSSEAELAEADSESSLSQLRKELRRKRSDDDSSPGRKDRETALANRLLCIPDDVDPEIEAYLREASHTDILEAAVVALVENGTISLADLVDVLGE